jgi:hypothetical protein
VARTCERDGRFHHGLLFLLFSNLRPRSDKNRNGNYNNYQRGKHRILDTFVFHLYFPFTKGLILFLFPFQKRNLEGLAV